MENETNRFVVVVELKSVPGITTGMVVDAGTPEEALASWKADPLHEEKYSVVRVVPDAEAKRATLKSQY